MDMRGLLVLCVVFEVVGMALFLRGFFPLKAQSTVTHAAYGHQRTSDAAPMFDRLVFVLIDALRADFALSNATECSEAYMPFVCSSIHGGEAKAFRATAHSPTVTMPRIKALMSGSIPGFIDVVLNFGSSAFTEDNIMTQLSSQNKPIAFYGDDTWLKLFPDHFFRYEGTTSFFVSDYTEVDNNVTRYLDFELAATDWHTLVLHYLGLDHIGHLAGPQSKLIRPKLREMDEILQRIFADMDHRTLLVVCGDHGMTAEGGHGGSSPNETLTPLVFFSHNWPSLAVSVHDIMQIDLAPTLSSLIGTPIPVNNLGVIIPDVFKGLPYSQQLLYASENAMQLKNILQQSVSDIEKEPSFHLLNQAISSHESLLESPSEASDIVAEKVLQQYIKSMSAMRTKISSSLTQYDLHSMGVAMIIMSSAFISLLSLNAGESVAFRILPLIHSALSMITIMLHTLLCTSSYASPLICMWNATSVIIIIIVIINICLCVSLVTSSEWRLFRFPISSVSLPECFLILVTISHSLSLLSTSFIEEEHQVWYYSTVTLVFLMALSLLRENARNKHLFIQTLKGNQIRSLILLMVLCRIIRAWNRTGDKWKHLPDIADWLTEPDHAAELSVIVLLSLVWIAFEASSSPHSVILNLFTCLCIYLHRAQTGSLVAAIIDKNTKGVFYARCSFACIALTIASSVSVPMKKRLHSALILTVCLLLRPQNIPLLLLFVLQSRLLSSVVKRMRPMSIAVIYTWMGNAAFHALGNSNSISTIDVSAGYVGLVHYDPIVIGSLMVLHTYSGPLFFFSAFISQAFHSNLSKKSVAQVTQVLLILRFLPLSIFIPFITSERYHLFIWSVFSPKLLYEGSHLIFHAVLYLILLLVH